MDIQHLVDRLEDLIDEGRHVPMSKFTMIDEERALSIIDQMRISVPEQIENAARVVSQRDRLLAQANEEAERLIDHAKKKSEELLKEDNRLLAAQHQANLIIEQAYLEAERVRGDADGYVMDVLRELESHLLRTLTVVRNGVAKVAQDREAAQQRRVQASQPQPVQAPPPPAIEAEAPKATMPVRKRQEVPVDVDTQS